MLCFQQSIPSLDLQQPDGLLTCTGYHQHWPVLALLLLLELLSRLSVCAHMSHHALTTQWCKETADWRLWPAHMEQHLSLKRLVEY
jgi:hypothetical protein